MDNVGCYCLCRSILTCVKSAGVLVLFVPFMAFLFVFFFFKQKTAYEILTCDWSSDVCSSDLRQRKTVFKYEKSIKFANISGGFGEI